MLHLSTTIYDETHHHAIINLYSVGLDPALNFFVTCCALVHLFYLKYDDAWQLRK
jgi:hypothetical protein